MSTYHSFIHIKDTALFTQQSHPFADRPVIVFLHDSLGSVTLWRDFPEKLCSLLNCNMVIYDRQGYGKSSPLTNLHRTNEYLENEADILYALITKLDLQRVILFGHSDGGSIALIAAGKYPHMFEALVVEAAHIFVEAVTLQGIRAAVHQYATTDLKARLEKYHGEKADTVFKVWTETWLRDDFRLWNIEHFLPSIICPLLFVQGDQDEYGTVKQIERVLELVGDRAQSLLINNAHHTPHKETPAAVIEGIVSFLEEVVG